MYIRTERKKIGNHCVRRILTVMMAVCLSAGVLSGSPVTVKAAQQPETAALILYAWNGAGENGGLMNLELTVNGTLNNGAQVSAVGSGPIVAQDGTLVGELAAADGQILLSLYRLDGNFGLELANGEDWMLYGINNIGESNAVAAVALQGQEPQMLALTEDRMYRSYTGLWFLGMGLEQGVLTEYSGN